VAARERVKNEGERSEEEVSVNNIGGRLLIGPLRGPIGSHANPKLRC
jgi:hypothetical protein